MALAVQRGKSLRNGRAPDTTLSDFAKVARPSLPPPPNAAVGGRGGRTIRLGLDKNPVGDYTHRENAPSSEGVGLARQSHPYIRARSFHAAVRPYDKLHGRHSPDL